MEDNYCTSCIIEIQDLIEEAADQDIVAANNGSFVGWRLKVVEIQVVAKNKHFPLPHLFASLLWSQRYESRCAKNVHKHSSAKEMASHKSARQDANCQWSPPSPIGHCALCSGWRHCRQLAGSQHMPPLQLPPLQFAGEARFFSASRYSRSIQLPDRLIAADS